MIIKRYFVREILKILIPSLIILVSIFISSALVKYLNYASRGDISIKFLPKLLLIELPGLLGILIPIALFLSILVTVSRLFAQSELVVLRSSGMSAGQILNAMSGLVIGLCCLVSFFVFWLRPQLMEVKADLIAHAKANAVVDMFKPGRFQVLGHDDPRTLYIGKLTSDHGYIEGIFSAKRDRHSNQLDIILAKRGFLAKENGGRYFVLEDGVQYHGHPGERQYRVTTFKRYHALVKQLTVEPKRDSIEALPTKTLWQFASTEPEYMAELQWRTSIPITLLILAMLAIPLGYVAPRSSQYANLIPALLILVIYINGLLVIRDALESNRIPALLGVWWYHGLFLSLAFVLFRRRLR